MYLHNIKAEALFFEMGHVFAETEIARYCHLADCRSGKLHHCQNFFKVRKVKPLF